ncbi:hypothetical protein Ancab_032929 [Ancistrocladus abbreviatus]
MEPRITVPPSSKQLSRLWLGLRWLARVLVSQHCWCLGGGLVDVEEKWSYTVDDGRSEVGDYRSGGG